GPDVPGRRAGGGGDHPDRGELLEHVPGGPARHPAYAGQPRADPFLRSPLQTGALSRVRADRGHRSHAGPGPRRHPDGAPRRAPADRGDSVRAGLAVLLLAILAGGATAQGGPGVRSGVRPGRYVIRNAMVIAGNGTPASGPYDIV